MSLEIYFICLDIIYLFLFEIVLKNLFCNLFLKLFFLLIVTFLIANEIVLYYFTVWLNYANIFWDMLREYLTVCLWDIFRYSFSAANPRPIFNLKLLLLSLFNNLFRRVSRCVCNLFLLKQDFSLLLFLGILRK